MNIKEIKEKAAEMSTWDEGSNKRIGMNALGSLLLARMGQIEYKEGIYLEKDQLRTPSFWDHLFHLKINHTWLEYDDSNVFDGTRRVCLVCGYTESSIMNREHAFFEDSGDEGLDLKKLLAFIKSRDTSEKRLKEGLE